MVFLIMLLGVSVFINVCFYSSLRKAQERVRELQEVADGGTK